MPGPAARRTVFVDQLNAPGSAPVVLGLGSNSLVGRVVDVAVGSQLGADLIAETTLCNVVDDEIIEVFVELRHTSVATGVTNVVQRRAINIQPLACESVPITGAVESLPPGLNAFTLVVIFAIGSLATTGASLYTALVPSARLTVTP